MQTEGRHRARAAPHPAIMRWTSRSPRSTAMTRGEGDERSSWQPDLEQRRVTAMGSSHRSPRRVFLADRVIVLDAAAGTIGDQFGSIVRGARVEVMNTSSSASTCGRVRSRARPAGGRVISHDAAGTRWRSACAWGSSPTIGCGSSRFVVVEWPAFLIPGRRAKSPVRCTGDRERLYTRTVRDESARRCSVRARLCVGVRAGSVMRGRATVEYYLHPWCDVQGLCPRWRWHRSRDLVRPRIPPRS